MSPGRSPPPMALGLAAALVVLVLGLALHTGPPAGPSVDGLQPEGLRTLYRVARETGRPTRRWTRPLAELPAADGTLVVAAPLQTGWSGEDTRALRRWMGQGGRVVLLTSGEEPGPAEGALLDALNIQVVERRADPPLWWPRWQAWRRATVPLDSLREGWPDDVRWRLPRRAPRPPLGARPLYADAEGRALAWTRRWSPGALVVLAGGSAVDNAGIALGSNAELALRLVAAGRTVTFDEIHHGHLADTALAARTLLGPIELLGAHLLLLYLLAVYSLARPMGPALPAARDRRGSVARDLAVLARLHRRSGHATAAGARLLQLARERARRRGLPAGLLPERFDGGEAELLALARAIGRLQAEGRL